MYHCSNPQLDGTSLLSLWLVSWNLPSSLSVREELWCKNNLKSSALGVEKILKQLHNTKSSLTGRPRQYHWNQAYAIGGYKLQLHCIEHTTWIWREILCLDSAAQRAAVEITHN